MKIQIDIEEAIVHVEDGWNDRVWLRIKVPSLLYKVDHTTLETESPPGTGVTWVKTHFGLDAKVVGQKEQALLEKVVPEKTLLESCGMWPHLLADLGVVSGRAEARRIISGGGLRVDGAMVMHNDESWNGRDGTIIQVGKKYYKLRKEAVNADLLKG